MREKIKDPFGAAVLVAGLIIVLQACALAATSKFKPDPVKAEAVSARLARLDIRYEILLKDDPDQTDTQLFRQKLAEAKKALDNGNYAKAEGLTTEAESWLDEAGPRFYRDHEARVVAGAAGESGDELMSEALVYLERALAAQKSGDEFTSGQFFQAAVEEGELALLSEQRSPEQSFELIRLAGQMQGIYEAAGRTEEAKTSKNRVLGHLNQLISDQARQLQDRLGGMAPGYDEATLKQGLEVVDKAAEEMRGLNQKRMALIEAANGFEPGRFTPQDYSAAINLWTSNWHNRIKNPQGTDLGSNNDPNHGQNQILDLINEHNQKYKQGSEPIAGSGILVEESDIFASGGSVIIRGTVQNNKTEPILRPRVVICGQVISDEIDLGYQQFNPRMKTTFNATLKYFNADAFKEKLGQVPSHEIVVIFGESNGRERKVVQPGRR